MLCFFLTFCLLLCCGQIEYGSGKAFVGGNAFHDNDRYIGHCEVDMLRRDGTVCAGVAGVNNWRIAPKSYHLSQKSIGYAAAYACGHIVFALRHRFSCQLAELRNTAGFYVSHLFLDAAQKEQGLQHRFCYLFGDGVCGRLFVIFEKK